ncbi:MAG TPA: helix-turn-helix transcriptional regulator [Acidimicrobiia bacterium]
MKGKVGSPEALGLLLQQARLARGLSQQELAQQLGISQSYVSEMESGKNSLALVRVFEFMRATGMTLQATVLEPGEFGDEA